VSATGLSATGLVVALQANFCQVVLDHPGPGGQDHLLCIRRTRLSKSGQQICVGDRVGVDGIDWVAGRGAVARLEPRTTLLERPAVANVSRVVVVTALEEPHLDPLQLTRFLLTAEATGQAVQLVLAKADLVEAPRLAAWCQRTTGWGYPPIALSCQSGGGLERLRQVLSQPGISVLCGPSGVGKSSLLNALLPALQLRVGEVSGRLQRGRHTTRHVELFPLAPGALVADSPGFNRPALPSDPLALAPLFPELRSRLAGGDSCRFRNCRHQDDPGCIFGSNWDRFEFYGQCLEEVEAQARLLANRCRPEGAGLKQRGARLEPRLESQWRRGSRRLDRQRLAEEEDLSPPGPAGSDPDRR